MTTAGNLLSLSKFSLIMYGNKNKKSHNTGKSPSQDWYVLLFLYNLPLPCLGRRKKRHPKQKIILHRMIDINSHLFSKSSKKSHLNSKSTSM